MFTYRINAEIELRLLQHDHADEIFALVDRNRDYLRRWFVWVDPTVSVDDIRTFIRKGLEKLGQGSELHTGIWYQGRLAGIISLFDINPHSGNGEIGYWLSEDCQGKGLMTMACRALLDHAFTTLNLHRIQIKMEPINTRSAAIPKRLGFRREGTLRQSGIVRGEPVDQEVHAILREEWEAQR